VVNPSQHQGLENFLDHPGGDPRHQSCDKDNASEGGHPAGQVSLDIISEHRGNFGAVLDRQYNADNQSADAGY
jgi:hypothetical protein